MIHPRPDSTRVVVTGIGVVSPIGTSFEDFRAALREGRNGVGPITAFDGSVFRTSHAGEIKHLPPGTGAVAPSGATKPIDRASKLALIAAREAVDTSGLLRGEFD